MYISNNLVSNSTVVSTIYKKKQKDEHVVKFVAVRLSGIILHDRIFLCLLFGFVTWVNVHVSPAQTLTSQMFLSKISARSYL